MNEALFLNVPSALRPVPVVSRPLLAPAHAPARMVSLTGRQFDVLQLLCEGQSNKTIARDLGIAYATVKVHVSAILRALGASNRTEAVVRAQERGLAPGQRGSGTGSIGILATVPTP